MSPAAHNEDHPPAASRSATHIETGLERVSLHRSRSSQSTTPAASSHDSRSSSLAPEEPRGASDTTSTPDGAALPKPRKSTKKPFSRPVVRFNELQSMTQEACSTFQVISDCLYGSRNMGSADAEMLDCDCAEDWRDGENHACEDEGCINRATKVECVDQACTCGDGCQNQRFQQKQYANVSVIKTEKKGYGLRADSDLGKDEFVFEYIGEVINEPTFRQRMRKYDEQGIKHFYFMSLTKYEFIDATKKGNLGRFCNHSCNPNCYVDKWSVGAKVRMGIFTARPIAAGEELVFDYNVDRYGADPQPCYCGEDNCIGFIGGKTQTDDDVVARLKDSVIEALGLDDDEPSSKRAKKKKMAEADEAFINNARTRALRIKDIPKVIQTLRDSVQPKFVIAKMLSRVQDCQDAHLMAQVARLHGYQSCKIALRNWGDDPNVALQILDILDRFPRVSKNRITDSKIEEEVEQLVQASKDERVCEAAKKLLAEWNKLETTLRMRRGQVAEGSEPRRVFYDERRGDRLKREKEEASKPSSPAPIIQAPKGPRSSVPQRNPSFFGKRPRPYDPPLPRGWFRNWDENRRKYYYYTYGNGRVTWERPTQPADAEYIAQREEKERTRAKAVADFIHTATAATKETTTPKHEEATPSTDGKKKKYDWRSMPVEKQKKLYENTLHPYIMKVVQKFQNELPRDDIKRLARELNKALVDSDFRHERISDPTEISEHHAKKVRHSAIEFFSKAVKKRRDREKQRAERHAREKATQAQKSQPQSPKSTPSSAALALDSTTATLAGIEGDDVVMSDNDSDILDTPTSGEKKRKRDDLESTGQTPSDANRTKRVREESDAPTPPPPPPPPPPQEDLEASTGQSTMFSTSRNSEEQSMLEQEEALRRENEEAQRLDDEEKKAAEEALERENDEAMREFEKEKFSKDPFKANGLVVATTYGDPQPTSNGLGLKG